MLWIIFGVLIFGFTGVIIKNNPSLHRYKNVGRLIGFLFVVLGIFTACIVQINVGEAGVKVLFGKVQKDILGSGLHFINPLLNIERVDIKTQNYTMSGINDEGDKRGDDAIKVLASDGLEVTIDLTVLYRVVASEAPKLLNETGNDYKDKIVRPLTRTNMERLPLGGFMVTGPHNT